MRIVSFKFQVKNVEIKHFDFKLFCFRWNYETNETDETIHFDKVESFDSDETIHSDKIDSSDSDGTIYSDKIESSDFKSDNSFYSPKITKKVFLVQDFILFIFFAWIFVTW